MGQRSMPRRRTEDGVVSALPELDALTADDSAYLRAMLGLAETGSMFQGRYVEAHVARVLGAQLPTTGISRWDLYLPGPRNLTIEVKATTSGGSFSVKGIDKPIDLWIFVTYEHDDKTRRPHGFRYAVGSPSRVKRIANGRRTVDAVELIDNLKGMSTAAALRATVERHRGSPKG